LLITALALAVFLFSDGSAALAQGLASRFGAWWPLTNGVYVVVAVFGFAALTFPLSYYEEHALEHRYELSRQSFGGWLVDYFKGLALELVLALVFFEVLYALLRWAPGSWWLLATAFYVVFTIGLSAVAPVLIMPLFHKFEPLDNPELVARVTEFAQRAGLKVTGVFRWGLAEKTATANAALAGLGRTRRIILGDTLLSGLHHRRNSGRTRPRTRSPAPPRPHAPAGGGHDAGRAGLLFRASRARQTGTRRRFRWPGGYRQFSDPRFLPAHLLAVDDAAGQRLFAPTANTPPTPTPSPTLVPAAPLTAALEKLATQNS